MYIYIVCIICMYIRSNYMSWCFDSLGTCRDLVSA